MGTPYDVTSSSPLSLLPLGPNILLIALFSNTLNPCSLSVTDHMPYAYKTTGKIIASSYILNGKTKGFRPSRHSLRLI